MTEREHGVDVLTRVRRRQPLCKADHAPVLKLIESGHMHVNPVRDIKDPCPYLLTEKGERALARALSSTVEHQGGLL